MEITRHEPQDPQDPFRKPKQERGLVRYNHLLDAAHRLLETQEPQDVGLYQVAKEADMPPASAYHFFPTPGSIFLALAQRYHGLISKQVSGAQPPADGRWQTLLSDHIYRMVELYNANIPMMKIMIGPHNSRELVSYDSRFVEGMSLALTEISMRFFHMPVVRDPQHRFLVLLTLLDSIWGLSYVKHGKITPEFATESAVAGIAYCRTFLPEFIALRTSPMF